MRVWPIAGAAFVPSAVPKLNRGRIDTEFAVETKDSVGLPGLIGKDGGRSETFEVNRGIVVGLSGLAAEANDKFEPLIDSKRLRRSSNGAPVFA